MKKFLYYLMALCLALPLATACSDSDDDNPVSGTLTLDSSTESSYTFGPESNSFQVKFTSTINWSISALNADKSNCSWITFGSTSGAGGIQTVKVILATNQKADTRTAIVTVAAGTATQTITVTQTGQDTQFMTEADVKDFDKYYKPEEFAKIDMLRSDAKWSWFRSKQSEHFFVFWEAGFGDDPNSDELDESMRVDIDDMLVKAEQFYKTNIETLKMATVGKGQSYLDKYKMEIYILYQTEWLATGSGYDNTIGALWVNPSTCHPVGSVIGHEIGHSFQYQVACDKGLQGVADVSQYGFRYGYGTNGAGGNGFWEQCAQWQSFQDYPQQAFLEYFDTWKQNCHRHFNHEFMRYASFWLQYYWAQQHGIDAVGRVWNESYYPEDPLTTYKRLYLGGDLNALYAELYDYAARMANFDLDLVRPYATNADRTYTTTMCDVADGYYRVAYSSCPSTSGFNVITLNTPEAGTTVKVHFRGLDPGTALAADDPGTQVNEDQKTVGYATAYNAGNASNAGWRYGFVAVDGNGTCHYGAMNADREGTASYTVPDGTVKLQFIVLGAPSTYNAQVWDDDESNDAQWPYEVKFEGTDIPGHFNIDETADPQSITLTYDLACDASSSEYIQGTLDLSLSAELAQAFVMKPTLLNGKIQSVGTQPAEGLVVIGLKQPAGGYSFNSTANNGFWCKADGAIGAWGDNSPVYVEFNGLTWTYGAYPGEPVAGTTYTIRPTLIYTVGGQTYYAEIVMNLKF